jgi:hypothetical protein
MCPEHLNSLNFTGMSRLFSHTAVNFHQPVSKGQNGRKRKQPTSSSGPATSAGTGNTAGPNSAPSTPSTHTAGDVMSMASGLQQNGGSSKPLLMYGSDGSGPLGGSSNQLVRINEHWHTSAEMFISSLGILVSSF